MSKKAKQEEVIPTIEEEFISISTMFGGKDLLKDGSNLNTKLNSDNHYYQHVHRLDPESDYPFYYVIDYDSIQYKGGPYKTIYIANIECTKHLYLLNNLEEEPVIA